MERLSLHHASTITTPVRDLLAACAGAGVGQVGLLQGRNDPVPETAAMLADLGLRATSCSPVGFWAAGHDAEGRPWGRDEQLRGLDEAAALGAPVVFAIAGPTPPGTPSAEVRARVAAGLAELAPAAAERDLVLAVEPLHPMFRGDRSALCTLGEAVAVVQEVGSPAVGLNLDTYHLWWEPDLGPLLERIPEGIAMVQLSDWLAPVGPEPLFSRGLPGEGTADLAGLLALDPVRAYTGPLEVEVLNAELRDQPVTEAVARMVASYRSGIAPHL